MASHETFVAAESESPHRVTAIQSRTPTIVELELEPLEGALAYRPGQYVLLEDERHQLPPRSYSIANAPRPDGSISLLVTRVEDGMTSRWAHDDLRVGDGVLVSGPYGAFVDAPGSTRPLLLIAGGSGLAPMRALAEAELAVDRRRPVAILFSARTEADVLDRDRFSRWEARHPRFGFVRTLTREDGAPPHGRIPALLPGLHDDLGGHDVFVAGAPGFVRDCAAAAEALGAPRARIRTEPFFVEPVPWSGPTPTP